MKCGTDKAGIKSDLKKTEEWKWFGQAEGERRRTGILGRGDIMTKGMSGILVSFI